MNQHKHERGARSLPHRVAFFAFGWALAAALYLLLIDITSLPELIVGAGAAVLAAAGFELTRETELAEVRSKLRWLTRLGRPVAKVPSDVAVVSVLALRQLLHPKRVSGRFRAVPFRCDPDPRLDTGKRALAESFGSFAPNTIIVGVDGEREMVLGHQLRPSGGSEAIDVLGLG